MAWKETTATVATVFQLMQEWGPECQMSQTCEDIPRILSIISCVFFCEVRREGKCTIIFRNWSTNQPQQVFFREGNLDILADFFFRPGLTMSKDRTTIEPLRSRLAFHGMPWSHDGFSIPIGSMYAIYGNMDPINIPQMLAYIPYMDPMG